MKKKIRTTMAIDPDTHQMLMDFKKKMTPPPPHNKMTTALCLRMLMQCWDEHCGQ